MCGYTILFQTDNSLLSNGTTSSRAQVRSGPSQWSGLGPLLLLIPLSDINNEIMYYTVSLFADDTRIQELNIVRVSHRAFGFYFVTTR